MKDEYFCINCNHKGSVDGIITLLTPCERCDSLLIVPIASVHMFQLEDLVMSMPTLVAEESQYRKWRGKKHLRVVPDEAVGVPENGSTVPKNVTDGGGNEEA